MKKSELATLFSHISLMYYDFTETGFKKEYNLPDFTFLDYVPKKEEPILKKADIHNSIEVKQKKMKIIALAEKIIYCKNCPFHQNVKKVPGAGKIDSDIFVISYPPSDVEESFGRPLSGETGDFFTKWINAINIDFKDVFITNLIKCPPKKRQITKDVIETCCNHLNEQLEIVKPKLILALGQLTLSSLRKSFTNLNENHGHIFYYKNIPFIPTFHPLDVLKNKTLKKAVWDDLKHFKQYYEELTS